MDGMKTRMASIRNNIANGKEECRWCDTCGTLLLGERCARCGKEGRIFEINSPGDIRPCMGESVGILEDLLREAFGTSSPIEGKNVFFNKVPGEDRTDEIVAHGQVIGVLRFDLREDRLKVELRQAGAELFAPVATKNIVRVFGVSGHLKGKSVAGENVSEITGDFGNEEPIIVLKGQKVGPGVSMAPSSEMEGAEKALRIRDLDAPAGIPVSPDADRKVFVDANRDHLKRLEKTAVREIRDYVKDRKQPVTVSFSGGKDSLAAYGIASRAVDNIELLFTDTGLEFPETLAYVEEFAEKNKLKLHRAEAGSGFRDNVDTFGPPAKDFRWCCKVCKLGPITDLIARDFPKGTITCEGNRSLESFSRADTQLVTRNPFVPNQTNLNPVRDWCAAEIWGYIWMRGLDYNPLYERDFERIGCYLCASCLASEWRNTSRIHPGMYSDWEKYLHAYAERNGLPPEYIDMGFWRWKVLPPKMRQLAEGLDLRTEPKGTGMSMKMLKGASVCVAGGYSMEAVATVPRNRDFDYVEDALRTVGEVKYSPEFEIALVRTGYGRAKLFGGGQISVTAENAKDAETMFERSVKALIRAELCTECGICAKTCARKAIHIKGGMRVDPGKCTSCGRCERSCMVIHYYDKIMSGKSVPKPDSCPVRRKDKSPGKSVGRKPYRPRTGGRPQGKMNQNGNCRR
ncbi:3'-phosphoadenosine 5'-phosphosulfate sulfotransferase (PAPS reductase)/FAD synthetase-related enzyme [Thermoplasmatales archaeon BRNA1]|nr:3'-phosphoadenosine 5'-phosphosulfate sulfotransferase (PAPS reductase)/FAD synthetase-related enzyme [Thermoplasmatales archaeon BRNA1]